MAIGDLPAELGLGGGAGLHGDEMVGGLARFLAEVKTSVETLESASGGGAVVAVTQSAPQALGDGDGVTFFPVAWSAETADELGFHAPASTDLVVPTGQAGLYEAAAVVTLTGPTPGNDYAIRLAVNGVEEARINVSAAGGGVFVSHTIDLPAVPVNLADGDVVTFEVLHNEGAALNTAPSGTYASLKQL